MSLRQFFPCALLIAMILLFLFSPTLLMTGCHGGLTLWSRLLIPALFPFLILTGLFRLFCTKSDQPWFYILIGFLSGYPIGASLLASSRNTQMRHDFYLGLTNNPSPAFILTYVGRQVLSLGNSCYLFYLMIIVSVILGNLLGNLVLTPVYVNAPLGKCNQAPSSRAVDQILWNSIQTILKIGGYVVFFSILVVFLDIPLGNQSLLSAIITSLTELTTGMARLCIFPFSTTKIALAAGLVAFGGFCQVLQTQSVIAGSGLSIFNYIIRRFLCGIIAMILTFLFLFLQGR